MRGVAIDAGGAFVVPGGEQAPVNAFCIDLFYENVAGAAGVGEIGFGDFRVVVLVRQDVVYTVTV